MMGSEGPVVQADSTWFSEPHIVRGSTATVTDLTPQSCARWSTPALFGYAAFAAVAGFPNSKTSPVTQMRCMITASLRATATVARFMPRRLATEMPQARNRDHLRMRAINADAAS